MTDLYPWAPPDGVEMLIVWLSPLGEVRDERPSGGVLPFWMVNGLGGPDDGLTEQGQYSVHAFAETKAEAQAAAMDAHRRILLLASRFTEPQKVTISTGTVQADQVVVVEKPHFEQWVEDNSIYRYVATYRMDLRYTAT